MLNVEVSKCEEFFGTLTPKAFQISRADLPIFSLLAVALYGDQVDKLVKVEKTPTVLFSLERIVDLSPYVLLHGEAAFELDKDEKTPWKIQVRRASYLQGKSIFISGRYTAKLSMNHSFIIQTDKIEEMKKLITFGEILGINLIKESILSYCHKGNLEVSL